jgi:hypothetical protein
MASLALVIIIAVGVFAWTRATRQSRQRWLSRLDLPGSWRWQDHEGELELLGELDHGRYCLRDEDDEEERGEWRLVGHDLILTAHPSGAQSRLDLRFFSEGTIGIHGPGREHRIYVKKRGNVVPLRRPA